jgi:hypothetical protein
MTTRDTLLAIALFALIALALAIQGGAWGPSDLQIFQQTAQPNL